MSNFVKYLGLAFTIANEVAQAKAQLSSGQPVNLPGIKMYIGQQHLELDLTIKPL